jgi:Flp pilus assembly pilin Flp
LRTDAAGQGLIEYAVMLALVAITLIGVLLLLRNSVGGVLNTTSQAVSPSSGNPGPAGPPPAASSNPKPDSTSSDSSGEGRSR